MRGINVPDLVAFGHALMDIRIFVDEFPEPHGKKKTDKTSLGGGRTAANVAVGAALLGVESGFIGKIGFDTFGRVLLEELEHEAVDVTHVRVDTTTNSGLTLRGVNKRGQVMMFGCAGASDKLFPSDLNTDYISSAEHIHITGLSFETAFGAAKTECVE